MRSSRLRRTRIPSACRRHWSGSRTGSCPSTFASPPEVLFGKPAQAIVDYAADNGFDLIVMGTHGRAGIAHLLMGSVAERVVRHATCPVMTIHEGQVKADVRALVASRLSAVA